MYHRGSGVVQDYKEAIKWYRVAAMQGYSMARCNLGLMYINGTGILKDYKEGIKWLRFAAEQGNAIAQANLGLIYYKGENVAEDKFIAHIWLNIANSQGSKLAKENKDKLMKNMSELQIEKAKDLTEEYFLRLSLFSIRQNFP